MTDVEGQEITLADAGVEVGANLFFSECPVMDGGETDYPFPGAVICATW